MSMIIASSDLGRYGYVSRGGRGRNWPRQHATYYLSSAALPAYLPVHSRRLLPKATDRALTARTGTHTLSLSLTWLDRCVLLCPRVLVTWHLAPAILQRLLVPWPHGTGPSCPACHATLELRK